MRVAGLVVRAKGPTGVATHCSRRRQLGPDGLAAGWVGDAFPPVGESGDEQQATSAGEQRFRFGTR